jgi:hypothetical protein
MSWKTKYPHSAKTFWIYWNRRGIQATSKKRAEESMKKEYDFSKGECGKFYHPDAELNLPVFLDPDVAAFLRELAEKKELKSRALSTIGSGRA